MSVNRPETSHLSAKLKLAKVRLFIISGLPILLILVFLFLEVTERESEKLGDINQADEMVVALAQRYNLTEVIEAYNPVIDAIERYQSDYGTYPASLSELVPIYLSEEPDIYIRAGEKLYYSPASEHAGEAPFVFYVYGHHTGLQFMHGWEFRYCPVELDECGQPNTRHYHPHRVNDQWIWINRSAL